jgi:hypothetical protein
MKLKSGLKWIEDKRTPDELLDLIEAKGQNYQRRWRCCDGWSSKKRKTAI